MKKSINKPHPMASLVVSPSPHSHSLSNSTFLPQPQSLLPCSTNSHIHGTTPFILPYKLNRNPPTYLHASRRPSNFPQEAGNLAGDPRNWSRNNRGGVVIGGDYGDDDEEEDEDEGEDRSLDLLVRFVENVFRKISKKARKAVRSVLPVNISTQLSLEDDGEEGRIAEKLVMGESVARLAHYGPKRGVMQDLKDILPHICYEVGFSVNGVIILAFLWVLKAFLEVVCTLGSVIFVSILLIRGVWSGISFLQENRYRRKDEVDDDHQAWVGTQLPVT